MKQTYHPFEGYFTSRFLEWFPSYPSTPYLNLKPGHWRTTSSYSGYVFQGHYMYDLVLSGDSPRMSMTPPTATRLH